MLPMTYDPHQLPVSAATTGAPLMTRAVHLADRIQMDWADFLFMLELIERYDAAQGSATPPPTAL